MWSNTHKAWCPGQVESISPEGLVVVAMWLPVPEPGNLATKRLPPDHLQLRKPAAAAATPPSIAASFTRGDAVGVPPAAASGALPAASPAQHRGPIRVAVVAPGAGTHANASVYEDLRAMPEVSLKIEGRGGAAYDRYPAHWPGGVATPNLESFASDLLDSKLLDESDCLVFGSRGGQVVLPSFWARYGAKVPPAVVVNGGCAMRLPTQVQWPTEAVTFLLLGGQDNFRGKLSIEEYLANARSRIPKNNKTTAILFVNEMPHMPQASLLGAVLPHVIRALVAWRFRGNATPPHDKLQAVLKAVSQRGQWSGLLTHTVGAGAWTDWSFGVGSPACVQQ